MAPIDPPPGKPPAMTAVQYNKRIKQVVSLRNALGEAECVDEYGVLLDDDAAVTGWAILPDRQDSAAFDAALADHNMTLDARSLEPPVCSDGGEVGSLGVSVRFSANRSEGTE